MLSSSKRYLVLLVCFLAAPAIGLPAALLVNTTCELGTCASPDTLAADTSTSATFDFIYTFANTDMYRVYGDLGASNSTTDGTGIRIDLTAVYLGNAAGGLSANDVLTTDMLQNYTVSGSLDGNYFERSDANISGPIAGDSSFEAQLYYNGNGLGAIGPFVGPGFYSGASDADLSGLTNPLSADFRFIFTFGEGSAPGAMISTVVPEPGEALPLGIAIVAGLLLPAIRRSGRFSGLA